MKVLISAYSCEPGKGSERGVGWNVAREVAKHHEVWVLTRPDESREAIEAELAQNPVSNLHFVYFTLPFWKDSLRWGQSGAMQIHYYLWQIQAYFVAKQLHQEIAFDIIHHVTFVKYSSPSFLSLLPVPFVWGAVGGGETTPPAFWQDFSFKNRIYETLRLLARGMGELDPFTRITAQQSTIAFATTEETAQKVKSMGAHQVKISSETALSQQEIDQLAHFPIPDTPSIRFISIARLLHWKGFHLGLRAFAQANLPDAEYWVVGDGPEAKRLASLAMDLGVAHQVKFWGLLEREQVLAKLAQSSVLVHPSLHDSGGWVCLEGMAAGRPIICLELGGPAQQVTQETGFKIPAHFPEQAIAIMSQAMVQLAENQQLRVQMGKAGQQRVQHYYNWTAKGNELSYIYQTITRKTNDELRD